MESLEQCKIKALRRGVPSRKKRWEAVLGIVAAGAFIWDLYTDSMAYRGNDFYKAATVSTIAFAIGISVGLLATGAGMPAGTALLAEVLTGTATGILEGPIKNSGLATEIERVVL